MKKIALNGNNTSDVKQTAEALQRAEVILKCKRLRQFLMEIL